MPGSIYLIASFARTVATIANGSFGDVAGTKPWERSASQRICPLMAASTIFCALVVDDDALILMHACDILEAAGFRFYEAGSGDEALALLATLAENVTLLFSDVEMPGKVDGFALARHASEHWPWIEIVIASGRAAPGEGDLPAKATFISKPFTNEMVIAHLRRTLPDGKQPGPLRQAI